MTQNNLEKFYLPITLFASTMGFGGMALVYGKLVKDLAFPNEIFEILKWLDTGVFTLLALSLFLRIFKDTEGLKAEFNHPVKVNFFAAIPISMFLLSSLWIDVDIVNKVIYFIGLIYITFFTIKVSTLWFRRNLELKFLNPAWFIPVVGNVVAVFTAANHWTWLWYYFSVGCVFYILLLGMILFRLIFSEPMPASMKPSLFIFIAPPSLCFIDYVFLTGEMSSIAYIFLSIAIFFALLLMVMWQDFTKLKFTSSWWAFCFPVATFSSALLLAYEYSSCAYFLYGGTLVFAILATLVAITSWKTVMAGFKGELE